MTEERLEYLPEGYYFQDAHSVPIGIAARETAWYLGGWADRYSAYPLRQPALRREGMLVGDPDARRSVIDDVLSWLTSVVDSIELAALTLHERDNWLLDAHDGFPGVLLLTPREFEQLQEHWESRGLPRDLFYPATLQRRAVAPVRQFGGVVRGYRQYSPLQWSYKDATAADSLRVPSEEERDRRFLEACNDFLLALGLRIAELSEPGRGEDTQEATAMLNSLRRDVLRTTRWARQRAASAEHTGGG